MNPNSAPKSKTRKYVIILLVILLIVILIIVAVFSYPFILAATSREYRTIDNIPSPIQNSVSGNVSTRLSGSNWSANAKHLASYQIEGLVVGLDDYTTNSLYDRVSPRDISLAWGDMAAHNNLITWERSHREMNAEVSLFAEIVIGKKYDELFSQYSNNHLIFNDDSVRETALSIKRGDHIIITGSLVDVTIRDNNDRNAYYKLTSSLRRDDDGDDSCEVILVTDIKILD